MLGLRKLLLRSRRIVGRLNTISPMLSRHHQRRVAIWLAASCVLVVLLGVMQFAWIGWVDNAQRAAIQAPLRGALRLVIAQLHEEMLLLLTTFDPGADFEAARRRELYTQRLRSWRQTSMYEGAVKRILFLDLRAPKGEALTELTDGSFTVHPAKWSSELAPVRQKIRNVGFKPDRSISRRGLVTWMLYPQPLALYRPITVPSTVSGDSSVGGTVTGYLILQLNPDLIRDRLIPKVLDHRLGELARRDRYTVTIAIDGEDLLVYEPPGIVGMAGEERGADNAGVAGYSRRALPGSEAAGHAGPNDPVYPFLLSSGSVPQPAARRGAIQQIALRSPVDIMRAIGGNRGQPDPEDGLSLDHADADDLFNTPLTVSMGLPRLFLVSEQPYRLTLRAGLAGTTFEAAMNSEYKRSVAIGILVLALVIGSMAMVAVSGINATRQAEIRLGAVASQSHHLRTPLAAITVLADNLASGKLRAAHEVSEHAGLIREYGQQLNEIVDSTTELAVVRSSKGRSGLTLIDVSEEASNALVEAEPIIRDAGFTAESALADDLPWVRADATALRRCVGELLRNAVKYGLPGKWLRVETCESGSGRKREVRIRVHDRGPGVASRESRKILEPYYRAPDVVAQAIAGSGLGLTLVLCSVEEMGGKLTIEDGESGGSVFTIHLPIPR